MKNRKFFLFILIVLLTLLAVWVDNPWDIPVKFKFGNYQINRVVKGNTLALEAGKLQLYKEVKPRLGLDLQGGTHLVLEADMKGIEANNRDRALESAMIVIERRVNFFGVSEPIVQTAKVGDSYRVLVEIPGVKDINEAINLLGATAKLQFKELKPEVATKAAETVVNPQSWRETEVVGTDLKSAEVTFNQQKAGEPAVLLHFTDAGRNKFSEIAKRNVGKPVGIFLDENIISYPRISAEFAAGVVNDPVITGIGKLDDAKQLAIQINAGALPVSIKIIEQRTIGATLGSSSIHRSIIAGILGFVVVALFMIISYGVRGVIAVAALIIYSLITLALFKLIPITLTLAGIAGFILSVGMAVDANILIFERMREEERWGSSRMNAIELGFNRAFPSIRDSNISSLITAGILYWFGTGLVRGFALTLAVGILVSLFTAVTVTRTFLRLTYRS